MHITLALEGNIGAGKSTFLKLLAKHLPQIHPFQEPVGLWQNENAEENLLDLFYQDMPRWAYTFQSYTFISRIKQHIKTLKEVSKDICIIERSIYCDRYCFAKNCFEAGFISPLEWKIYTEWFDWLTEHFTARPQGFIYLKTDPSTCVERINERGRAEEKTIAFSYLESLHAKHEEWLVEKRNIVKELEHVPVLELDFNQNFLANEQLEQQFVAQVTDFITKVKALQRAQAPASMHAHSITL
jgi:deoxyguanosine kinase